MAQSFEAVKIANDLEQGNLRQYEGEWIAVHEDTILGHARTLDRLLNEQPVRAKLDFSSDLEEQEKIKSSPLFMYVMGDDFQ